jgi:hypothetical protein
VAHVRTAAEAAVAATDAVDAAAEAAVDVVVTADTEAMAAVEAAANQQLNRTEKPREERGFTFCEL